MISSSEAVATEMMIVNSMITERREPGGGQGDGKLGHGTCGFWSHLLASLPDKSLSTKRCGGGDRKPIRNCRCVVLAATYQTGMHSYQC
jgi:hypothetical protein